MVKERETSDVRTESIGATAQGEQAAQPTQLALLQQFMQALAKAASSAPAPAANEPTAAEKAAAYAESHVAAASPGSAYWCVDIRHLDGKQEAPFMNFPRIFCCLEHQAPELYKKFYGIRHTEHQIVTWVATEKQFAAQTKRDAERFAGVHHSRLNAEVMKTLPPMPEMAGVA